MELLSHRPIYNDRQSLEYLMHIGFDCSRLTEGLQLNEHHRWRENWANAVQSPLGGLRTLQRLQLAKVPFENLSLHYSGHKTLNLDPTALYEKIVTRGRGGYCMEVNSFFGTILRTHGYNVINVGGRVHQSNGAYTAWSHMVNLVNLPDGKRYLVDVGFGNNGPTRPLLLEEGHEENGITPTSMRLVREKIPATTNPDDRLWIYQHRINPMSEWEPLYCFTETEFLPRDFEMMDFWTSQNRKSFFTYSILCVRTIMDEKSHQLVGTLILTGAEVKRRIGDKTEQVVVCKTESERIEILERLFGINLTQEERQGVQGMVTALPE